MSVAIFDQPRFLFPYDYKFPGQASGEKILFITRENRSVLRLRQFSMILVGLVVLAVGWGLGSVLQPLAGEATAVVVQLLTIVLAISFTLIGWWWVTTLWRRSIAMVTTQRLVKFIYTTPFNRHILSLPLEMIVDTGSYTKGFIQALFKLGTFTARSSASSSGAATDDPKGERINKKYFYIENVAAAEDLQHYVNKLLTAFRHHYDYLPNFRPFIPHLKGEARQEFMQQYPDYWS